MSDGLFSDATSVLTEAMQYADISPDTVELLRQPKSVLQVSIPVRRDDGATGRTPVDERNFTSPFEQCRRRRR